MAHAYQIQVSEEDKTLRLALDNRRLPKDNFTFGFLVLFWVIWAPLTVFCTTVLYFAVWSGNAETAIFFTVWCTFGWLGTLLIPYTLLGRWRSEWIKVSPASISHGFSGPWAPKTRTYLLGPDVKLALGRFEEDSIVTLSLVWTSPFGLQKRALFAYWLAPNSKEQVFLAIAAFVAAHKVPLVLKRNGG
jgi:hypothetical protein